MKFLSKALLVAAMALMPMSSAFAAPDFPKRQITIIVPYLAGGMVELFTRPIADAMSKELGVPVTVQVSPGGGGAIGNTKALKAKPDGYTILMTSSISFTFHPVTKNVQYNENSAIPLCSAGKTTAMFIIDPKQDKFHTFEELIEYCKAHPKEVTTGVTGLTSLHKAWASKIQANTGCELQLVPYDGALGVTNAVVSGHLMSGFTEYTQNSELKPVLFLTSKNEFFPNVRDFSDVGMPDAVQDSFFAFYAPKGTPEPVVKKLTEVLSKCSQTSDAKKIMESFSVAPWVIEGAEITKLLDQQRELVKQLVAAGEIPSERSK